MANTKLFKNGNSQAVRIPAELAYGSWDIDLDIERRGKVFEMNMDLLPFNRARVIAAGDAQQPFRRPASP